MEVSHLSLLFESWWKKLYGKKRMKTYLPAGVVRTVAQINNRGST